MTMRQGRCGCWQSAPPKRWPWFYKPGSWTSWKPASFGSDEWCRRTLVLGLGLVTGVLVIPLRECRGCPGCGPNVIDEVWLIHDVTDPIEASAHARQITP